MGVRFVNFQPSSWHCVANLAVPIGGVHLWAVSYETLGERLPDPARFLSPPELERANRFVLHRDGHRFATARAYLRHTLASYLEMTPSDIAFEYGPQGKPSLAGHSRKTSIEFNMSHCDTLVLLGLAEQPIGVDVERVREIEGRNDIAKQYFTNDECQAILDVSPEDQSDRFFRCWTSKEAVIKAWGTGLGESLVSFKVMTPSGQSSLTSVDSNDALFSRWTLMQIRPMPGIVGAAAVPFPAETTLATLLSA